MRQAARQPEECQRQPAGVPIAPAPGKLGSSRTPVTVWQISSQNAWHSGVSVVVNCRVMMRVSAITTVPTSSSSTTGVHRSPPGRSMISTPPKPTSVESARRQRIRSPSIGTAITVMISGAVKPTA